MLYSITLFGDRQDSEFLPDSTLLHAYVDSACLHNASLVNTMSGPPSLNVSRPRPRGMSVYFFRYAQLGDRQRLKRQSQPQQHQWTPASPPTWYSRVSRSTSTRWICMQDPNSTVVRLLAAQVAGSRSQ